ncbi:MAG: VCBS repeat-containing protein [Candidatus Marinimicrobia bacterium]|nr:VCBS repeat-containing protein [Candidatus Neomarinimicrobiota bacterium]
MIKIILLIIIGYNQLTGQLFEDITDQSGTAVYRPQYSFFGAGATMADFDQDGYIDVFVATPNGEALKVFHNLGNETFEEVAELIGLGDENIESINILVADYDNDGHEDIFVVNWQGLSNLYHNDGDNTYSLVTEEAGMSIYFESSRAGCWLDYDRDGDLDLYMVNRLLEELNILYRNNGDGTFSDVTQIAGVDGHIDKMGLVVISFDYNNDLWPDIYIGNDMDVGNIFYRNNGDGTFTDISEESNMDLAFSSMGLAAGDYDNNGYLDIYITNLDWGNALMRNNGDGTFTDVAEELGLLVNLICWGANFIDHNNDGLIDLFVAASCISGTGNDGSLGCSWNGGQSDVLPTNNVLFQNQGDGQFVDISGQSGLEGPYLTTGSAIGDINNDGLIDIYEVNEMDPISPASNYSRLYRNNYSEETSEINNWIKVKLEGVESNRNGIGSRIEVSNLGVTHIQDVICGESYSSQSSLTLSFGLRHSSVIESIIIKWPSGTVDELTNVQPNQVLIVQEGGGEECGELGDLNGDGGWNVLDIVTLANCVLAGNCAELENGCAGDLNGDGGYNVLDIVTLANCVLAGNCGG